MKNGLALFLGVFATVGLSWAALLLTAHHQLGGLGQFKDPIDDTLYPQPLSGLANQGRLVYQDLGCVSCHTQQVRREGFGADIERKWGERASYARDYIRDPAVLLGQSRLGPDLRNVGKRIPEADYFYQLLYAPESTIGGAPIAHGMPAHTFLFDVHPTAGRQPSDQALKLTGKAAPAAGFEVVPSTRARALVAYLQSLKDTYDYPVERERNADAAKPKEEGTGSAKPPAGAPAEKPKAATPAEKPKEGGH
jgi:cytochrome c oxidase cbb3-type subunit 2